MKDIIIVILLLSVIFLLCFVFELDDKVTLLEDNYVSMWTSQLETNKVQLEFNKNILDFEVNTNRRNDNLLGSIVYCFNVEDEWVCSK